MRINPGAQAAVLVTFGCVAACREEAPRSKRVVEPASTASAEPPAVGPTCAGRAAASFAGKWEATRAGVVTTTELKADGAFVTKGAQSMTGQWAVTDKGFVWNPGSPAEATQALVECADDSFSLRLKGAEVERFTRAKPPKESDVALRIGSVLAGAKLAAIQPGTFEMGSVMEAQEQPVHTVTITRPFELLTTEITHAQWEQIMKTDRLGWRLIPDHPVTSVSWFDAAAFCNALSRAMGIDEAYDIAAKSGTPGTILYDAIVTWKGYDSPGFRLPTEAEWEFAARAGSKEQRYGELDDIAWHAGNSDELTHPVGQKKPNDWGLHDMLGNAWEWVWDQKGPYLPGPATDPTGPETGYIRRSRGGAFKFGSSYVRASFRGDDKPTYWSTSVGFRVARTLK